MSECVICGRQAPEGEFTGTPPVCRNGDVCYLHFRDLLTVMPLAREITSVRDAVSAWRARELYR